MDHSNNSTEKSIRRSIRNSLLKIIYEERTSRAGSASSSSPQSPLPKHSDPRPSISKNKQPLSSNADSLNQRSSLSELLSDDQVAHLKAAFELYDQDGSGTISFEEFKEFLGPAVTNEDIHAILNDGDTNGDGEVDFQEFKSMIVRQMVPNMYDDWMREAFDFLDSNGDNVLSLSELRNVLTAGEIGTLLGGDKNGDGQIDYDEFVEMMSSFVENDTELPLMI